MIEVLLFGRCAEVADVGTIQLEFEGDVKTFSAMMVSKIPELVECDWRVSVNKKLVNDDAQISEGDEVAILPPFAGG